MKKLIILLIVMSMFSSISLVNGKTTKGTGAVESKYKAKELNNYSNRVKASNLPSSYKSVTTSVKDQGYYSNCWAFSTIALAENNLIKKGLANSSIDLSESQLAYFTFNNVGDPLKLASKDKTIIEGSYNNYLNTGFNAYCVTNLLSNYLGLVKENKATYNTFSNGYSKKSSLAYKSNSYILENTKRIADYNKDKSKVYNSIVPIKYIIMNYGGVSANFRSSEYNGTSKLNNFSEKYSSYYNKKKLSIDHSITIIGWDDNYSKNNFNTKPSVNGAWIIKNSWGTDLGDNGYYYISYQDATLSELLALSVIPASTYQNNYHYDGTASNSCFNLSKGSIASNIYTTKSSEELKAIGVSINDTNRVGTINIYKNPKKVTKYINGKKQAIIDPTSGTKVNTTTFSTDYSGYYTIPLSKSVQLNKNDKFSIVVSFNKDTNVFVDMDSRDYYSYYDIHYKNVCAKNQSIQKYKYNNKWYYDDLSAYSACFRIKALTNNITYSNVNGSYNYTGDYINPNVVVKYKGKELIKDQDYTITYSNNINIGKATINITFKDTTIGSKTIYFNIKPKSTSISSLKANKKGFKIKWEKLSSKMKTKTIDGYQIQYSTSSKFKNSKYIKVKGYKTTNKTINKLLKRKKYYVRIRTYSGNTYSNWSKECVRKSV